MFHITDWFPTLLTAAGVSEYATRKVDGVDQWRTIADGRRTHRELMVYNLEKDPFKGAIRKGDYKLIFGPEEYLKRNSGWYNTDIQSKVPYDTTKDKEKVKRCKSSVSRVERSYDMVNCKDLFTKSWPKLGKMLFNISQDPEERKDLSIVEKKVMQDMYKYLKYLYGSYVESDNPEKEKKGSPKHFKNVWSPGWC